MIEFYRLRYLVFAFFVMTALAASQTEAADAPEITFEERTIVARGVTPGGRVAFFGIAHEAREFALRMIDFARVLADDDHDGIVRYEIDRVVPAESAWVVVDLRHGRHRIVSSAAAKKVKRKELPATSLQKADSAHKGRIVYPHDFAIAWFVRPDGTPLSRAVHDGHDGDADGTVDGVLTLNLEDLRDVGDEKTAKPSDFRADDLVILVDPLNLVISDARWKEK